jgi:hypothetical protein
MTRDIHDPFAPITTNELHSYWRCGQNIRNLFVLPGSTLERNLSELPSVPGASYLQAEVGVKSPARQALTSVLAEQGGVVTPLDLVGVVQRLTDTEGVSIVHVQAGLTRAKNPYQRIGYVVGNQAAIKLS